MTADSTLMLVAQCMAAALACVILFFASESVTRAGRNTAAFFALGLGIRVFAGIALLCGGLWEVTAARGLHIRRGIWFFALDALGYVEQAKRLAAAGPGAIVQDASGPGTFFVQVLAATLLVFSESAATPLLLTIGCYVLSSVLLVRMSHGSETTAARAMAALACCPSLVLWTVQPLKESMVIFLLLAFVAVADQVRSAFQSASLPRLMASCMGLIVILYAVASSRSFVGVILLILAPCFVLAACIEAKRWPLLLLTGLVVIVTPLAVLRGIGANMTPSVKDLLARRSVVDIVLHIPDAAIADIQWTRRGYENSGGRTLIGLGPALGSNEQSSTNTVALPKTVTSRLITGATVLLLPMRAAEETQLVRVGQPRARVFRVFADVDTVFFDAVLVLALTGVCARRSQRRSDLVFWLAAALTIALAFTTVYVLANFGTFLRLRTTVMAMLIVTYVLSRRPATRLRPPHSSEPLILGPAAADRRLLDVDEDVSPLNALGTLAKSRNPTNS